jgi:hypothetical protein
VHNPCILKGSERLKLKTSLQRVVIDGEVRVILNNFQSFIFRWMNRFDDTVTNKQ